MESGFRPVMTGGAQPSRPLPAPAPERTLAAEPSRVLRNTYWLLALSMIPTMLGAVVGVTFKFPALSGFMGFMLFMAIAFGFFWAIEKNKNSAMGVVLLLAFNHRPWLAPVCEPRRPAPARFRRQHTDGDRQRRAPTDDS